MNDRDPDLRTLLRAYLESEREALDEHPLPEQLEAFQKGELSAAETRRIREHLPLCPDCTDFVLTRGSPLGLDADAAEDVSPEELEAAWFDLREKIHREGTGTRPRHRLVLLAAVLALAAVGLSLWCWQLYLRDRQSATAVSNLATALKAERNRSAGLTARAREQSRRIAALDQELAAALRPRINTPVLDLAPRLSRGQREPVSEVPAGSDLFTLILEPEGRRAFPVYAVEILDSQGRSLWSLEGLVRTEFGNLTLILVRRTLPAGEVRLRLYGIEGGRRMEAGTYVFSNPDR